ncbi:putative dirigent protein [Helianthus debilis subsp. tardiflorus]
MSNPIFFTIPLIAIPILYWAYTYPKNKYKQTNLVLYVHDNHTGDDKSAMTIAGKDGPTTSIMHFGTLLAHDAPVTLGPDPRSKEVGRAQGMYINSQLDGKALYMIFSIMFNDEDYKNSTLEIQGADPFVLKEREFSVVSGTGYFRFVRGYGIMTTEFLDIQNKRGIIKLNITVRHF